MKIIRSSQTVKVPKGVSLEAKKRVVTVQGPRGKITKAFKHLNMDMRVEENGRLFRADLWFGKKKQIAAVRTVCSHVQNMITGVTKGYRYKMKFVYAHFPINANVTNEGKTLEIRKFLGEYVVRNIAMLDGVTVSRSDNVKDEIALEGNDIENVGQTAALIHQSCLVRNKDIRKFLDGIYVSEKGPIG